MASSSFLQRCLVAAMVLGLMVLSMSVTVLTRHGRSEHYTSFKRALESRAEIAAEFKTLSAQTERNLDLVDKVGRNEQVLQGLELNMLRLRHQMLALLHSRVRIADGVEEGDAVEQKKNVLGGGGVMNGEVGGGEMRQGNGEPGVPRENADMMLLQDFILKKAEAEKEKKIPHGENKKGQRGDSRGPFAETGSAADEYKSATEVDAEEVEGLGGVAEFIKEEKDGDLDGQFADVIPAGTLAVGEATKKNPAVADTLLTIEIPVVVVVEEADIQRADMGFERLSFRLQEIRSRMYALDGDLNLVDNRTSLSFPLFLSPYRTTAALEHVFSKLRYGSSSSSGGTNGTDDPRESGRVVKDKTTGARNTTGDTLSASSMSQAVFYLPFLESDGSSNAAKKGTGHFQFMLRTLFQDHKYSRAVFLDSKLDVSSDILAYMGTMAPLLTRDPELLCVLASNPNAASLANAYDPAVFYRTDYFPSMHDGLMLQRASMLQLLELKSFPAHDAGLDAWLRSAEVRQKRTCLYPELSRAVSTNAAAEDRLFIVQAEVAAGNEGGDAGLGAEKKRAEEAARRTPLPLNRNMINYRHLNTSHLQDGAYKLRLQAAIGLGSRIEHVQELDGKKDGDFVITYGSVDARSRIYRAVGMLPDYWLQPEQRGLSADPDLFKYNKPIPGSYEGVIPLRVGGKRLFVVKKVVWSKA